MDDGYKKLHIELREYIGQASRSSASSWCMLIADLHKEAAPK